MTAEFLSAAIALFVMIGSIIGVWVALNTKLKELEMKILELEHKFVDVKEFNESILKIIEKNNDKIWNKLEDITDLINSRNEDLIVLKSEHKNNMELCKKINVKK